MGYPSTTIETKTAKCYVCEEVVSKHRMVNIGQDKENEGRYIFRCQDCNAGSDKWLKHFMHRSHLRSLFINAEGKKMDTDLMRMVGQKIVEKTREKHEKAICDAMDKGKALGSAEARNGEPAVQRAISKRGEVSKKSLSKPKDEVATPVGQKGGVNGKKSWRTVTIRRSRR